MRTLRVKILWPQGTEAYKVRLLAQIPNVVARQADVLPTQGRQMVLREFEQVLPPCGVALGGVRLDGIGRDIRRRWLISRKSSSAKV